MYEPNGNHYTTMDGGWMTGFAVVTMVLLLIAVIAVVANLYFHVSNGRDGGHPHATVPPAAPQARVVLDARLARGEVSPEEYRGLRELLDS